MHNAAALSPPSGATSRMFAHRPVMLDETLAGLQVRAGGIYIDGTYGRGGHTQAMLDLLGEGGQFHAFDQDPEACADAREKHGARANFHIHHRNFSSLAATCDEIGISGRVDGILMDLGVSSPQLDNADRGFSFMRDGALDMRMNPQAGYSAAEWLARAEETEIADVLFQLGEERNSRRIARRIVENRNETPITTTAQLASLVAAVPGPRSHRIHPATRTFQAIRIFINRELDVLPQALEQAVQVLAPQGRLVVISFHSLEDRIVKRYIRNQAQAEVPSLRVLKKQMPSDAECAVNPRARSAVLRIAEKLP